MEKCFLPISSWKEFDLKEFEDTTERCRTGFIAGTSWIWSCTNHELWLRENQSGKLVNKFSFQEHGNNVEVTAVILLPKIQLAVALDCEDKGACVIFDMKKFNRIWELTLTFPVLYLSAGVMDEKFVIALGTAEGHLYLWSEKGNSLFHLNETSFDTVKKFTFFSNDGSKLGIQNRNHVMVTAVIVLPALSAIAVGFNFGGFQLWDIHNNILLDSIIAQQEAVPIVQFIFQEPEEDPRCYYLWVVQSRIYMTAGHVPSLQLFNLQYKTFIDLEQGDTCLEYQQATLAFMMYLEGNPFSSGFKSPVVASKFINGVSLDNSPKIKLCCFSWECIQVKQERAVHIAIFDLNQWYSAFTPKTYTVNQENFCQYLAVVTVPVSQRCDQVLQVNVLGNSVSYFQGSHPISPKFQYPSAISFGVCILFNGNMQRYKFQSVQLQVLSRIRRIRPKNLCNPCDILESCELVGLISAHVRVLHTAGWKVVLSVALENNLGEFISKILAELQAYGWKYDSLFNWIMEEVHAVEKFYNSYDHVTGNLHQLAHCTTKLNILTRFTAEAGKLACMGKVYHWMMRVPVVLDGRKLESHILDLRERQGPLIIDNLCKKLEVTTIWQSTHLIPKSTIDIANIFKLDTNIEFLKEQIVMYFLLTICEGHNVVDIYAKHFQINEDIKKISRIHWLIDAGEYEDANKLIHTSHGVFTPQFMFKELAMMLIQKNQATLALYCSNLMTSTAERWDDQPGVYIEILAATGRVYQLMEFRRNRCQTMTKEMVTALHKYGHILRMLRESMLEPEERVEIEKLFNKCPELKTEREIYIIRYLNQHPSSITKFQVPDDTDQPSTSTISKTTDNRGKNFILSRATINHQSIGLYRNELHEAAAERIPLGESLLQHLKMEQQAINKAEENYERYGDSDATVERINERTHEQHKQWKKREGIQKAKAQTALRKRRALIMKKYANEDQIIARRKIRFILSAVLHNSYETACDSSETGSYHSCEEVGDTPLVLASDNVEKITFSLHKFIIKHTSRETEIHDSDANGHTNITPAELAVEPTSCPVNMALHQTPYLLIPEIIITAPSTDGYCETEIETGSDMYPTSTESIVPQPILEERRMTRYQKRLLERVQEEAANKKKQKTIKPFTMNTRQKSKALARGNGSSTTKPPTENASLPKLKRYY